MVSKKQKDLFEKAPILKAIFVVALPSILGQLILVIYNLADTYFVNLASQTSFYASQGLTEALQAGVGVCMPIFMLLSAISNLFGIGASSVMSRSMGKKNFERAKNSSRFAFYGCLITTIVYCLLVLAIINPITDFLCGNSNPMTQVFARKYIIITVISFGLPTAMNTFFSHIVRSEGKSFHASFGIALGGLLNVLLDWIFIMYIFKEDAVMGAALATGISNFVALLYYIFLFIRLRGQTNISFKFSKKMFADGICGEVLTIGLPACLMTFCENVSYFLLDANMALVSTEAAVNTAALAGVGAAKKVNMFAHSIARGMTQGVLPLIGYNKSSGKRVRMRKIFFTATAITCGISIVCLVINVLAAGPLCSVFSLNDDALKLAQQYLIIFSIGAPFSAFAYSVISFFQAVGKAWRSLILALLRKGILDIPLMYILPLFPAMEYIPGSAIVWATPIADIICCITAAVLIIYYLKRHGMVDKDNIESAPSALPHH